MNLTWCESVLVRAIPKNRVRNKKKNLKTLSVTTKFAIIRSYRKRTASSYNKLSKFHKGIIFFFGSKRQRNEDCVNCFPGEIFFLDCKRKRRMISSFSFSFLIRTKKQGMRDLKPTE